MKTTYLLIEVVRESLGQNDIRAFSAVIEDIHGTSDNVDVLKGVADEENYDAPLDWHLTLSGNWEAVNTKKSTHKFEIIQINKFK